MNDIIVGAVCMQTSTSEYKRNLKKIEKFAGLGKKKGVNILCFPELSISGYMLDSIEGRISKEQFDESIKYISKITYKTKILILAGLIEISDKGKPYISQLISYPNGQWLLYRKTHIAPPEENSYQSGEELPVFSFRNLRFGIELCYEAHFPEISTILALKGAEAIFMPHASPRGTPSDKLSGWKKHLKARAYDNGVYVIACNQVGENEDGFYFPGVALIINPSGEIISSYSGDQEYMLISELKRDAIQEVKAHPMKNFLKGRRPHLYTPLTTIHK